MTGTDSYRQMILTGADGQTEVYTLGPTTGDQCLIPEEDAREHLLYKARQGAVRDESEAHTTEYLRFIRDHDCATPEKFSDQWIADVVCEALDKRREECGGKIITFWDAWEAELAAEEKRRIQKSFDYVLGPFGMEKVGIFGTRRFHLIGGTSGNGKSTWTFQMLDAQWSGREFCGREGFGKEYLILWDDRGQADLDEQLFVMGLLDNPPPHALITAEQHALGPARAIEEIYLSREVKPQVIFVEGVDMWCDDAMDMKRVAPLVDSIRRVAEKYDIAIIGSTGSPKQKPGEKYEATRDRIFGSSAWARKSSTVVDIAMSHQSEERTITINSRVGQKQIVRMKFKDDSRLHEVVPAIAVGPEDLPSVKAIMAERGVGKSMAYRIRNKRG